MRRVVITGMGAVSALGHSATETWSAMREGRSAIGPIRSLPLDGLRSGVVAEVRDFDPARYFDAKKLIQLDRVSQFALVAAKEAITQSGIDFGVDALGENTAVVIGTGVGGQNTVDDSSRRLYGENNPRLHPLTIIRLMANAPACQVSIEYGLTGPSFAVVSACASANHALAQAFHMVRSGVADAAVAGGAEAPLTYGVIKAWEAMRVMADDTCRPFCKNAAASCSAKAPEFSSSKRTIARARGAAILAEFAGAGMSADAGDIVFPSEAGAAKAMQRALADGALTIDEIGYINAHGTGTPGNDPTESRAIRRVFGAHADRLAVSSTKSMHGHALGAAGAIELVAAIGALRDGVIAPTANFLSADPDCDLEYVPNVAREQSTGAVLSNSFAFGGLNAVLALRNVP